MTEFVVVIRSTGDGSDGYGFRFTHIKFRHRDAAQECCDKLNAMGGTSAFIIIDEEVQ